MIGALPQTCTILRRYQKQKLSYASGIAAFHTGATVTGGVSGATATIDTVTGTSATGVLLLTEIMGTFQSGEQITDSDPTAPGIAMSSTVSSVNRDSTNEGDFYWLTDQTNVPCRFYNKHGALRTLPNGQFTQQTPMVIFPPTVTITAKTHRVVSTNLGSMATFRIVYMKAPSGMNSLPDHYECELTEVL